MPLTSPTLETPFLTGGDPVPPAQGKFRIVVIHAHVATVALLAHDAEAEIEEVVTTVADIGHQADVVLG